MFGNKGRTSHHPDGTTITTTTHTTKTTTPHYPSRTSGIMSRLRNRRTANNNSATVSSGYGTPVSSRSSRSRGLMGGRKKRGHHSTTTTTAPRRKTSIGDKISGAMLKLKGSATGKPGVKAAGTRRMHGTDGRGARRYY